MVGLLTPKHGCDLSVRAGREILELITNQLSIAQWAQTLRMVRFSHLVSAAMQHETVTLGLAPFNHAALCLQTNQELRAIKPRTFVHCLDVDRRQVPEYLLLPYYVKGHII